MGISIIILSYNTKSLLKACLNSVLANLPKDQYEIIVVDNGSKDGSSDMVIKDFPKVELIQSAENLGFAKGVNLGAKKAKGEFLLFLNSDASLKDEKVKEMELFMRENELVGVIGGMLVNSDGTVQRSYGRFYTLPVTLKMLLKGDGGEIEKANEVKLKKVDWVSGGFMMVRQKLFEKLRGFDEHFFMYMEDVELCYRVKKAGFVTYVFPRATAVHLHQGSSGRSFAIEHIYKGLAYFYKKHRNRFEYAILKTMLYGKAGILIVIGILAGNTYLKKTYRKAMQFS